MGWLRLSITGADGATANRHQYEGPLGVAKSKAKVYNSYTVLLLWTQAEAGPPAKVHELGAGAQTTPPAVSLAPTTARPAVVPFKKMERIKTGFLGMFVKSI